VRHLIVAMLVVGLLVGAVGCGAEDDTIEGVVYAALGRAEKPDDMGVSEIVLNEAEGYLTVKYRLRPVIVDLRKIEAEVGRDMAHLVPKLFKLNQVETVSVMVLFRQKGFFQ